MSIRFSRQVFLVFLKMFGPFWTQNYGTLKVFKSVLPTPALVVFKPNALNLKPAQPKNPKVSAKEYVFTAQRRIEEIIFFIAFFCNHRG